jgi:hypothetical protein
MAPYNTQSEKKEIDPANSSAQLFRAHITAIVRGQNTASCILANQTSLLLPALCAGHIAIGDKIAFAIPDESAPRAEAYVTKNGKPGRKTSLYLVPTGYAAQPRVDRSGQGFVPVQIDGKLGISCVLIPCPRFANIFLRFAKTLAQRRLFTMFCESQTLPPLRKFALPISCARSN